MLRHIYKNVIANWLGLLTSITVGFFLTPFILHRLGDTAFGLWILMGTLGGYYGLLDLGIRNAVIRYVARYAASNDENELSGVISTSLFTYAGICLVLLVLTGMTAWKLEWLIHISAEWSHPAKLLLIIFGTGTALGFPLGVFGGVLEGLQRFTWTNGVQGITALVRAWLVVVTLEKGYGLLTVACITVALNVLSSALYIPLVYHFCPALEVKWRHAGKGTLRILAVFGLVTFWVGIGITLRFQVDAVVIGAFLSVPAISMFSISSKLVSYASDFVQSMATVFTPMSSHFDAKGDGHQLRRILLIGNRYASFVVLPITLIFVIVGKTIIRVWVGSRYLPTYPVLVILILPLTLGLMQAASTKVLYGMARHQILARVFVVEGLANLLLSILLLRWFGIIGVALGTAIPMACTNVLFLPRHLCGLFGLRLREFLTSAYLYPILLNIPFGVVLLLADRFIRHKSYITLLIELTLGVTPYVIGLFIYFEKEKRGERECLASIDLEGLDLEGTRAPANAPDVRRAVRAAHPF